MRSEVVLTVAPDREQLWPFVADTDRMDRATGLPPAQFTPRLRQEGGELVIGEYRLLCVPLARWVERPFEWQWPRQFSVVRDYLSGPLLRFHGGTELRCTPRGTQLRSFVEITPRYRWLAPFVRLGLAPVGLRRAARQHRAIAAFVADQASQPFPVLAEVRTRPNADRLRSALERLTTSGSPEAPTRRLVQLLVEAPDEDVAGMRPLELAQRWMLDPRVTLEAFIRATLAGLLEMRWELLCPRCRGVKATAMHLRDLAQGGFCPTCNLHFIITVDEAIEARFYPNPGVRKVEVGMYCVGSPAKTPHRLAQTVVQPGATHVWDLELQSGIYHLNSPQSGATVQLMVEPFATADRCTLRFGSERSEAQSLVAAPGHVSIGIENPGGSALTVGLDDARWSSRGATPGRLMMLPAFRTLLSTEALAPGFELAVGRVGLLFTDLAGSTALYEQIGDAAAFRLVGEHFRLLFGPIEAAGGAAVKTIGDAVMAAFPDGRSALVAALGIQRAIRSLNAPDTVDAARLLKIGVHVGACYAVTLNDRLDYFGTAVNLAARAEHEAQGGEIVATGAVMEEARAELETAGLEAEAFTAQLRGFGSPVELFRIDMSAN